MAAKYALIVSLACVFGNCVMIATEYIGEFFGKSYDEDNVKRKVITLLVSILASAISFTSLYVPFVSVSEISGILQIAGILLTAITFGMQTFYVWW